MTRFSDFRVAYPTLDYLGECTATVWYDYLLAGFRETGARVGLDWKLNEQGRSELGFQLAAIDIWHGPRGPCRVYYDWCDFDSSHPWLARDRDGKPPGLYYKIQSRLEMLAAGIRPIGQTVSKMEFFDELPRLRTLARQQPLHDVTGVFRTTARDLRCRAVRILRQNHRWSVLAGVSDYPRREPAPPAIVMPRMDWAEHLRHQAQSRICLALPGVGGDWTWRHVEVLAMGAFLLTIEPEYLLPGHPAGAFATCRRDLSDLADVIDYWLVHDTERREIAAAGRAYFDRALAPAAAAARILERAWQGLDR